LALLVVVALWVAVSLPLALLIGRGLRALGGRALADEVELYLRRMATPRTRRWTIGNVATVLVLAFVLAAAAGQRLPTPPRVLDPEGVASFLYGSPGRTPTPPSAAARLRQPSTTATATTEATTAVTTDAAAGTTTSSTTVDGVAGKKTTRALATPTTVPVDRSEPGEEQIDTTTSTSSTTSTSTSTSTSTTVVTDPTTTTTTTTTEPEPPEEPTGGN
jgi:hypothetical protein